MVGESLRLDNHVGVTTIGFAGYGNETQMQVEYGMNIFTKIGPLYTKTVNKK